MIAKSSADSGSRKDESKVKRMSSRMNTARGTSGSRSVLNCPAASAGLTRNGSTGAVPVAGSEGPASSAPMYRHELLLRDGTALAIDAESVVALELLDRRAEVERRGVALRAGAVAEVVETLLLSRQLVR